MPRVGSSSEQHVRVVMEEPRERDLLLVAARQLGHRLPGPRVRSAEPGAERDGRGIPRRALRSKPNRAGRRRQRDVVGDRQPEREPFVLAVLGEQADALREAATRRRAAVPDRRHADPSAANRVEAEHRAQQLGAAGADEPRDAEDLAAVERQLGRDRAAACPTTSSSSSTGSPGSCGTRG